MVRFSIISLFVLLSACSTTEIQKPQKFEYPKTVPQSLKISAERLAYIDELFQEYVDKGIIPHAVTFVAKNGVVIHNKAYGWSDVESKKILKKDYVFRMFSQTKAVTSVALMTLFEQGKFQLDDPVSKFIPECTDQVLLELKPDGSYLTRPVASPMTIRHLLCHTSGIAGNRSLQNLRREQARSRDKPYETLAEEVKELVQFPLAFDPGTQWNYHPSSDVVGYLVEYFSGMSLRDYVKETIFTPLGMVDTDWYYPESYRERMVTAYNEINGNLIPQPNVWSGGANLGISSWRSPFETDTRYCQGGTGLNGPIEDYARFCQMILNGGAFNGNRVLGRRTIEMMSVDQLPYPNNASPDFQLGLGFEIYPEKETQRKGVENFTSMVSPGSLKWGGMYKTDYLIDPKEDLIILLYTNRLPDTKVWEKFLNTVYQLLQ